MIRALLVKVSLLLILSGCKNQSVSDFDFLREFQIAPHTSVKDPIIHEILLDFLKDVEDVAPKDKIEKNLSKLVSYRFESLNSYIKENDYVGLCNVWLTGYRDIAIAPIYLYYPHLLRSIVYHELGNCLLDLEHDESRHSFMSEFLFGTDEYHRVFWEYELKKFKDYILKKYK
jgi:hypothetical protein